MVQRYSNTPLSSNVYCQDLPRSIKPLSIIPVDSGSVLKGPTTLCGTFESLNHRMVVPASTTTVPGINMFIPAYTRFRCNVSSITLLDSDMLVTCSLSMLTITFQICWWDSPFLPSRLEKSAESEYALPSTTCQLTVISTCPPELWIDSPLKVLRRVGWTAAIVTALPFAWSSICWTRVSFMAI